MQAQTAELRATVAGLRDTATAMDADLLRKTLGELKDTVADLKARVIDSSSCPASTPADAASRCDDAPLLKPCGIEQARKSLVPAVELRAAWSAGSV